MTNSAAILVFDSGSTTSEEAHGPGAVDPRSLSQLVRNRQEELPEQECCSRGCNQGKRQAGIGVDQAEIRDDLVRRQDADFHRQHQGNEDHPEKRTPERKAEIDKGESRHNGDRDLAAGNDQRHDQAVPHHLAYRRGAGAFNAVPEHGSIVVQHLAARPQLHWHAHHLVECERRRHERDVTGSITSAMPAMSATCERHRETGGGRSLGSVLHLALNPAELDRCQRNDDDHQHDRLCRGAA